MYKMNFCRKCNGGMAFAEAKSDSFLFIKHFSSFSSILYSYLLFKLISD